MSAYAYAALGDITGDQFRALASIQRELGADVRLTNRQNVVFRNLTEAQLPVLYERLQVIGMAEPGAELARDVVACPGADTCNLAVTQSRGLAKAIGETKEFKGVTGTITIDENHDATKSAVVVQMKGGKPTYVATIDPPKSEKK